MESGPLKSKKSKALKLERGFHDPSDGVGEETGFLIKTFQLLAVVLFQGGLVVPGIELGRASVHVEVNDGFGLPFEMGQVGQARVDVGAICRVETSMGTE